MGIDPRPTAVGSHFDTAAGRPILRTTTNLAERTMVLITPPGIATDANAGRRSNA